MAKTIKAGGKYSFGQACWASGMKKECFRARAAKFGIKQSDGVTYDEILMIMQVHAHGNRKFREIEAMKLREALEIEGIVPKDRRKPLPSAT